MFVLYPSYMFDIYVFKASNFNHNGYQHLNSTIDIKVAIPEVIIV